MTKAPDSFINRIDKAENRASREMLKTLTKMCKDYNITEMQLVQDTYRVLGQGGVCIQEASKDRSVTLMLRKRVRV